MCSNSELSQLIAVASADQTQRPNPLPMQRHLSYIYGVPLRAALFFFGY